RLARPTRTRREHQPPAAGRTPSRAAAPVHRAFHPAARPRPARISDRRGEGPRTHSMKIGVFYGRKYYLRNFADVLGVLARRGNELVLAMPDRKPKPFGLPRSVVQSQLASTALFPFTRDDGLDEAIRLVRAVGDAARYERSPLRAALANRRRAYRNLGRVLGMELEPPSFD